MKNKIILCLLFIAGLSAGQSIMANDAATFKWPNNVKAAVSLSYDDALNSQLDNAIPALDKHNLKGTFYLTLSSPVLTQRLSEWRAAAENGHELANHSLFHQCSRSQPGRDWVPVQHDLDKVSAIKLRDEIVVGNALLFAIDGKTERTFTAPCGDTTANGENYIELIKSEFVGIKSVIDDGITADMSKVDPSYVNFTAPSDVTGKDLINHVKKAAQKGTMANFTFHGIGGDHLQVSKEAHEELLSYLQKNKDIYWTDSFVNIMKYVRQQQAQ